MADGGDFRRTAQMATGVAIAALAAGAMLFVLVPRPGLMVVLLALAILFGAIVLLCVVTIPRRTRLSLIAALAILFVLTGSRIMLMGTAIQAVPVERADAPAEPGEDQRAGSPSPTVAAGGGGGSGRGTGDGRTGTGGAWTSDIGAVLAQAGQGNGARISILAVRIDRAAQLERAGVDWSIEAPGGRQICASLTVSAADRQAALEMIEAMFRAALDHSRATGRALCY